MTNYGLIIHDGREGVVRVSYLPLVWGEASVRLTSAFHPNATLALKSGCDPKLTLVDEPLNLRC